MLEVILDRKTYSKFLDYAINNCDAFSCVLEKDEHNKSKYIFQELYYCILDLIIDKKNIGYHPDTNTEFSNCDYIKVKNCQSLKFLFFKVHNIDEWNGIIFPEELCFYREDKVWFTYISHENILFVYNETRNDIDFFEQKKIKYHIV